MKWPVNCVLNHIQTIYNQKHVTSLSENKQKQHNAGLFRRLFALFYDWFLLLALLFITTAIFNALNHGIAIESDNKLYIPLIITLLALTYFFFTWFWVHGGQTLGLKTWKCKVTNINGGNVTWKQASIRFFVALVSIAAVGVGFLWSLFHKERKAWHDIASKTQLLDLR